MPRFKEHEIGSEDEFFDKGTHSQQINSAGRFKQSKFDPMSETAVSAPSSIQSTARSPYPASTYPAGGGSNLGQ